MPLALTSPAFAHNDSLPVRNTCDGDDLSPPLEWAGVPAAARSLVLIIDDPDAPDPAAPRMTWVHWILYNIPPDASGLPEGTAEKDLPPGTLAGTNDSHETTYGSPCPPVGTHRYFHRLYALDVMLPDLNHPAKPLLLAAMEGHVLAKAELIGLYRRQK